MKQLDAKLRSQVRRPQKEGVTVKFGADQVAPFFDVFAHHMRDLGTPTQPRLLFETIAAIFPDDAWFGCAWLRGPSRRVRLRLPVGKRSGDDVGLIAQRVQANRTEHAPLLSLHGARDRRGPHDVQLRPHARRASGTHKFKLQWGARDEQLWWYDRAESEEVKTPSPTDSGYSWGPRIWKRLPAAVATMLGPRIVRYIP